ncbi:MAG: hypothetical protein ACXVCY_04195 [Pseudobdellovibrionaceae bacterium]
MAFSSRPQSKKTTKPGSEYPQPNHEEITSFIKQWGSRIRYWKAVQCPCLNFTTGQPNIVCHNCRGLGWNHTEAETDEAYLRAKVNSRNVRKNKAQGGFNITGGASMTFLPGVIPAEGDLIQVCSDREIINDEVLVAGSTLTDYSSAEKLRFRDIISVESVFMYSDAKEARKLAPTEWQFDKTLRQIVFTDSVPAGTQYSVRYIAVPEYIIAPDSTKPLLRVAHDDSLVYPQRIQKEVVYPYFAQATRLDRAVLQRLRGNLDTTTSTTFNNFKKGPFV